MAPVEAARTVVGAGVAQLQANEEGVLASPNPEFVHQARVALRRTRSALRMFRREIGEVRANAWHDALGETSRALGDARDWDVFGSHTLPAALEAFGDAALTRSVRARIAHRRRVERLKAREAMRSPRYSAVILELARWLAHADAEIDPRALRAAPRFRGRVVRKRHSSSQGRSCWEASHPPSAIAYGSMRNGCDTGSDAPPPSLQAAAPRDDLGCP
jgi:CHAD domain-containing protein